MAKLYGIDKTDDEIIDFVNNHYKQLQKDKNSRFTISKNILSKLVTDNDQLVLDYGCGWGHYSIAFKELGYNVDAIDLSQNKIDICNLVWANKNINFQSKKITEFADKNYDVVFSSQVIEHVHNVGNYLSEINRVLKEIGILVITLPNVINPRFALPLAAGKKRLEKRIKNRNQEVINNYQKGNDHINSWDPYHFATLLGSLGFKIEEYLPGEGIPMPRHKLFKPYWRGPLSRNKQLECFSYTMSFICKKVSNSSIKNND